MPRKRSQKQIEKNERTRAALMRAAMRVVGRLGYSRASIGKIAEVAGVSTGTFYLFFKSKEQLYEVLLPWASEDLAAFAGPRVASTSCYMDFEERNIRGFFDYIELNPSFLRVLLEAETLAPTAWAAYCAKRESEYVALLNAAWDRGEFPGFDRSAVPQICVMLMALRREIVKRYFEKGGRGNNSPSATIGVYLNFVLGALHRINHAEIVALWRLSRASGQLEFAQVGRSADVG